MNPTTGDLHVNVPLTNVTVALMQSETAFIASRVFPNIPVSKQSDIYYTYEHGDFNRDEMQERADGAESAGGDWNVGEDLYYARVYAFHKDITDRLRANADSQFALDSEAAKFVTMKALLKREKIFVNTYFKGSVWGSELDGVASAPGANQTLHWNDANSDPISVVRAAKRTILEKTGIMPNKLVLGRAVYDTLIDHPDIIDRIKYGQRPGQATTANSADLARLFEVEEVMSADAVENTAKAGQPASHSFIAGKHALLAYAPPAAGLMTPSAGYTFSWTGYTGAAQNGQRIKQFRLERNAADRVEIEMAFACKKVSGELGFFFDGIVA